VSVRDIDHVVIMTRDLEQARAGWEALGFTTTPRAIHPFGTANSLVQLQGNFIELLEIDDPSNFPPPADGFFSFATHNQTFLAAHGEGASMLVLTSDDRDADLAGWRAAGLRTYEPVDFERQATLPDGSAARVAFSLAFAGDPALSGLGFFVCQQHTPETFWKPDYQRHANTAHRITGITLVTPAPEAARRFLETVSGGPAGPAGSDDGYRVALAHDRLTVVPGSRSAMPRMEIAVRDLDAVRSLIPDAQDDGVAVIVPSTITHGVTLRLTAVT